jgi:hypothetical protein
MTPLASRSSVKDMKQKLASGEFLTSTPLPVKPVELEEGYLPRLRDLQQKLADRAESEQNKNTKPTTYISPEELASMGERKRCVTEELFTEKDEPPKPIERPRMTRRRSDAELLDLLKSRKEEADQSATETAQEISSVVSDISSTFGDGKGEVKTEGKGEGQEGKDSPEQEKQRAKVEDKKKTENVKKTEENKREQEKKKDAEEQHR